MARNLFTEKEQAMDKFRTATYPSAQRAVHTVVRLFFNEVLAGLGQKGPMNARRRLSELPNEVTLFEPDKQVHAAPFTQDRVGLMGAQVDRISTRHHRTNSNEVWDVLTLFREHYGGSDPLRTDQLVKNGLRVYRDCFHSDAEPGNPVYGIRDTKYRAMPCSPVYIAYIAFQISSTVYSGVHSALHGAPGLRDVHIPLSTLAAVRTVEEKG